MASTALLLVSDLEFGGAQRQVVELANHMPEERFAVHVCSLSDYVPLAGTLKDSGRRFHIVQRKAKYDVSVVWRLARLIRELRADVVHCYLFDAQISGRLAGRLARRPVVIGSERNTDYHIPRRHHVIYRLTAWGNDMTIANSRAGAEFNSRMLGMPMGRYRVVHNGVDTDRFKAADRAAVRAELGLGLEAPVVGMFASFKAQKNHGLLLEAAAAVIKEVPGVRFLFVGDELWKGMSDSVEYKRGIHQRVVDLGLKDHCVFAGNRKDVERCYPACDLTVLPSLFEGTPNVALESMACGVPVVATGVSDNAYVIPHGRAGYIVPLGDGPALAQHIMRLLNDAVLRRRLGEQARSWVVSEFSCARLAEKTADVYSEAIQRRGGSRAGR